MSSNEAPVFFAKTLITGAIALFVVVCWSIFKPYIWGNVSGMVIVGTPVSVLDEPIYVWGNSLPVTWFGVILGLIALLLSFIAISTVQRAVR